MIEKSVYRSYKQNLGDDIFREGSLLNYCRWLFHFNFYHFYEYTLKYSLLKKLTLNFGSVTYINYIKVLFMLKFNSKNWKTKIYENFIFISIFMVALATKADFKLQSHLTRFNNLILYYKISRDFHVNFSQHYMKQRILFSVIRLLGDTRLWWIKIIIVTSI